MIPLRDSVRPKRTPVVNIFIIAFTFVVFVYELSLTNADLQASIYGYGLVPVNFVEGLVSPAGIPPWLALVTAIFLHGSWLHVIGNMLYLWVFGDNVEDRFGRLGYLVFYLAAGMAAGLAHIVANPTSPVPTIGASGAVAGVLGAYFVNFPRARVLALVPVGIFLPIVQVPAILFLLLWFGLQLINGVASLGVATQVTQGVAWWEHIGGFAAGVTIALAFRVFGSRPR